MIANIRESPLEGVEPFAELDIEELEQMDSVARVIDVPRNDWLYMEGDQRRHVYCLVSGRIKISRMSPTGKEFILELIEPGEIFGESCLFEDEPHDSFGIAFENSSVVTLPCADVMDLIERKPRVLLQLAKVVDIRKKRMESRLVILAFQKVRGRVASLLLQLCRDYGVRRADGVNLQIRLRHQEMANLIGVSREIVSHTLSDFRREGLIESNGRHLIVPQMQSLEHI